MSSFEIKKKIKEKNIKRILVVDLLYLGDLIFAIPFFKNLRKNFPEVVIDLIMNSSFSGVFKKNNFLDNIYYYDKKWSIKKSLEFARSFKTNNYDLGLNIHGNWRTTLLMKIINPDLIVGFSEKGKNILVDKAVESSSEKREYMVQVYLNFLKKLGLTIYENSINLEVSAAACSRIENYLKEKKISNNNLVILNTGGSWPTKRWPVKHFARLGDLIQDQEENQVIFTGGSNDQKRVQAVMKQMQYQAVSAVGATSIPELAALLKKSAVVISGDTGPVHVARALDTPTITLFGPSDEKKYHPRGDREKHKVIKTEIDCRPCGKHTCLQNHHKCMKNIEPQIVLKEINSFLE